MDQAGEVQKRNNKTNKIKLGYEGLCGLIGVFLSSL
jgi:hypothetical protein